MLKSWRFAALLIVLVMLMACSSGTESEADTKLSTQSASAVSSDSFPFMGGAELDAYLAANAGKPTMVLFWTTWCPSCKQQIPEMELLNKSHGDKMNIITISLDENVALLEKYFEGGKIDLPVYFGEQALAEKFNVSAIPTLVIFNKEGQLTFNKPGIFPHSMLTAMANNLIEK